METDAIGGGNYIHARIYIYIYDISLSAKIKFKCYN